MKIINLSYPLDTSLIPQGEVVLTLGFFDGVHLGHQQVINRARELADQQQLPLALMTFNQHPRIVYENISEDTFYYLSALQRKEELLAALGVDILYVVDYTYDFGSQSPQTFVDNYIVGLGATTVVAGFDYTYGKKDIANMQTLPSHAMGRFQVIEVPPLIIDDGKVATTSIKSYIQQGDMAAANTALGYVYEIYGTVIHGEKVGRTIGFPTANIQVPHPQLLPAKGIYAVEIEVKGQWYKGSASIGHNVTFYDNHDLTIEVYILDFKQWIYGEKVRVRWHHYLRGEIKFEGTEKLIEQLHQDEANTRTYFNQLERRSQT